MAKGKLQPFFKVIEPDCAGIDIGATMHYVSLVSGEVHTFGSFTADLIAMARWLSANGVTTAYMEATGSYWYQVFDMLEEHGIRPVVVDPRGVRRLPGRKTDVSDSQWLAQMGACGLLASCFIPEARCRDLRVYRRHRQTLVAASSQSVLRIQKALTEMNVQIHNVLSDVVGVSGMAILEAILDGQRDPNVLAKLCDPRVKAPKEKIVKSLEGHWSAAHLLVLRHTLEAYREILVKIAQIDEQIAKEVAQLAQTSEMPKKKNRVAKGEHPFELTAELEKIFGTDLTKVDGLATPSVLGLLAECGTDLSSFPSDKHFVSWLGLCPNHRITGGKVRSRKSKQVSTPLALIFRLAAQSVARTDTYLGAFYRAIAGRRGAPKAITATARKIAVIFYTLVKRQEPFKSQKAHDYDELHRQRNLKSITKRAAKLGFELKPVQVMAQVT
jgi:transposase